MNSVAKLLSLASESLCPYMAEERLKLEQTSFLPEDLTPLFSGVNGFYCFESALHVLSFNRCHRSYGLDEWNAINLWRNAYENLSEDYFFFGEDIFSRQFAYKNGEYLIFDPETGEFDYLANSLEEWARLIVDEYNSICGFVFAHEWQQRFGPLSDKQRLTPRTPFILGGDFHVSNFIAMDAAKSLRIRGALAKQISELPDGAYIQFEITE